MELNLELTDEIFDSELAKPGSEMFNNRTFWIEKEVCIKFKVAQYQKVYKPLTKALELFPSSFTRF